MSKLVKCILCGKRFTITDDNTRVLLEHIRSEHPSIHLSSSDLDVLSLTEKLVTVEDLGKKSEERESSKTVLDQTRSIKRDSSKPQSYQQDGPTRRESGQISFESAHSSFHETPKPADPEDGSSKRGNSQRTSFSVRNKLSEKEPLSEPNMPTKIPDAENTGKHSFFRDDKNDLNSPKSGDSPEFTTPVDGSSRKGITKRTPFSVGDSMSKKEPLSEPNMPPKSENRDSAEKFVGSNFNPKSSNRTPKNTDADNERNLNQRKYRKPKSLQPLYKTSVKKWRPGKGKIVCPKCGANERPLIKTEMNKVSHSPLGAACILTCWPFCFLPCVFPAPASEYLYCAECNYFLGAYNRNTESVQANDLQIPECVIVTKADVHEEPKRDDVNSKISSKSEAKSESPK